MDKSELRRLVRNRRLASPDDGSAVSFFYLESRPEFVSARTVLIFASLPDEVPTAGFIEKWSGSKRIVLPVVVGDDMELREYVPGRLREGYRGIMEPDEDSPLVSPSEIDLAVVPGVAFDLSGHRLGRGKGFYDRLLPRLGCPKFGLAFKSQIVDIVPTEDHDIPVDVVITV